MKFKCKIEVFDDTTHDFDDDSVRLTLAQMKQFFDWLVNMVNSDDVAMNQIVAVDLEHNTIDMFVTLNSNER